MNCPIKFLLVALAIVAFVLADANAEQQSEQSPQQAAENLPQAHEQAAAAVEPRAERSPCKRSPGPAPAPRCKRSPRCRREPQSERTRLRNMGN
jgi:hypothetical protein